MGKNVFRILKYLINKNYLLIKIILLFKQIVFVVA